MIFLSSYISEIKSIYRDVLKIPHLMYKILFVWGVYLLSYFSLIRSYMIFAADNKRVIGNTHPWITGGGRYLNDWLTPIIFASPDTQDIQPLPRIFALLILALATVLFVHIITKKITYFKLLLGTMIGLSPFFAQNISYNFDSIFMCSSLLFAIIPFLFWNSKQRVFLVISVITSFFWLGFYQSAISCYLMLLIYLSWQDFIQTKKTTLQIIKRFFLSFITIFLCCITADFALAFFLSSAGSYTQAHLPLCSDFTECLNSTINNFNLFMDLLKQHFYKTYFSAFFIFTALVFFIHIILQAVSLKHRFSRFDNILTAIMVSIGLFLSLFIYQSFLLYPQLDQRTITTLGLIVSIYFLDFQEIHSKLMQKILSVVGVSFVWGLIVFISTYGNLWSLQMQYDDYLINSIKKISMQYPNMKYSFPRNGFHIELVERQDKAFKFLINCIIKFGEERRIPQYYGISTCDDGSKKYQKKLYQNKLLTFTQINDTCIHVEYNH